LPAEILVNEGRLFHHNIKAGFSRDNLDINREGDRKETCKFIKYPKYEPAYSSFALMKNGWWVNAKNPLK
jgi:hypothetical protein